MMVEHAREVKHQLPSDLTQGKVEKSLSSHENKENAYAHIIQGLNKSLSGTGIATSQYLLGREYTQKSGDQHLLNILKTFPMFQFMNAAQQRNVQQAILSLVFAFRAASQTFDENLKRLKAQKYRLGQRVKKSGESRHS